MKILAYIILGSRGQTGIKKSEMMW